MISAGNRISHRSAVVRAILLGLAVSVATLITGSAVAVGSEAARIFRAGIEAADREQWATVVTEMTRAISSEPTPGGRVKIYGMRFEAYLPNYWLGVAQSHLGDCPSALRAFDNLATAPNWQDLLTPLQRRDLDDRKTRCRELIAATTLAAAVPTEALTAGQVLPPPAAPDRSDAQPPRKQAPPFLRRAAADFLAGRYEEVTATLQALDSQTTDTEATSTGLLLRSAARFALHRQQATPDGTQLSLVRRDLERLRELDPALKPSAFWFSPVFLELYNRDATP